MGKRNYVRPLAAVELFTPNEFVASCTDSAAMSPDGEFIYGWVMHCEDLDDLNIEGCKDVNYAKVNDQGQFVEWVPGIFIRSNNQSAGQNFGPTTVSSEYTVSEPTRYGNHYWWIITEQGGKQHAVIVQGSITNISYPFSYRFNVNQS